MLNLQARVGLPRAASFSRLLARPSRTWLLEGGNRGPQERIHPLGVAKYCGHVGIENDHDGILRNLPCEPIRPRLAIVKSILAGQAALVTISRTASLVHSLYARVALHVAR